MRNVSGERQREMTGVADCKVISPPLREVAPGHHVACLLR